MAYLNKDQYHSRAVSAANKMMNQEKKHWSEPQFTCLFCAGEESAHYADCNQETYYRRVGGKLTEQEREREQKTYYCRVCGRYWTGYWVGMPTPWYTQNEAGLWMISADIPPNPYIAMDVPVRWWTHYYDNPEGIPCDFFAVEKEKYPERFNEEGIGI